MKTSPKKPWKAYGRYGSVGIELILSMGIGYYLGHLLDRRFGTHWIALVGFLMGLYAGFRQIFIAAKRMQQDALREEEEERERHGLGPGGGVGGGDGGAA
jgi:F0F1-type ATP synthase assembly protein I